MTDQNDTTTKCAVRPTYGAKCWQTATVKFEHIFGYTVEVCEDHARSIFRKDSDYTERKTATSFDYTQPRTASDPHAYVAGLNARYSDKQFSIVSFDGYTASGRIRYTLGVRWAEQKAAAPGNGGQKGTER